MNAIFATNRKWVINKHSSKDRRKASVSHNESHYCGESGWKCMLLYLLFFSQRQSAPARGIAGVRERRELAHLCKGESSSVKLLQLHYHQINDSRRWERGNMVRSSFLSFPPPKYEFKEKKARCYQIISDNCTCWQWFNTWCGMLKFEREKACSLRVNERKVHCSDRLWLPYWANLQIRAVTREEALMWNPVFKELLFFT